MQFITNSSQETQHLAKELTPSLKIGDVVLLIGPLGVGKTLFVKGILRGLGIRSIVRSPSFTIIREYKTRAMKVCHIDLYRIKTVAELCNLGYEDYFYSPSGITLIEWADKIEEIVPRHIKVYLEYQGLNRRKIQIGVKNRPKIKWLADESVRN